jgi:hypothetical protein
MPFLDEKIDVAQRAGHPPVLERGAGVLAVVFVEEADARLCLQARVGLYYGRVAFSQIHHGRQGNHGPDKLVVAVDALDGRVLEHAPVVEDLPPRLAVDGFETFEPAVMQEQHTAAVRAGVQQRFDAVLLPAAQAAIDHLAARLRDQVRPDASGNWSSFIDPITSIPPMYGLSASGMTTLPSSC